MQVKGQVVVFSQIAEAWLSRSHNLFHCSFSDAVYAKSLNESEQFLWAGHEMDEVYLPFFLFLSYCPISYLR